MKSSLPLVAVLLGLLLLILSPLWGLIFPATNTWTEEKARRMTELGNEAHALLFQAIRAESRPNMKGGKNPAELRAKYNETKAELDALKAEFEGKRDRPKTIATYLRWSGIALVLIGGGAVMAARG